LAEVTLPQLGETVTEGTITKWLVKVGDKVEIDQPIFEVSTDKVDSEVPSPASGVVTEILVPEGETVDVGTVLARIEAASSAPAPPSPAQPAPSAATPTHLEPAAPPPTPPRLTEPQAAPSPTTPAREPVMQQVPEPQPAPTLPPPSAATQPSTPVAPTVPEVPSATEVARQEPSTAPQLDGLLLSPMVRKLIVDNGLDPRTLRGTGVGGRITRADVLRALDERARSGDDTRAAAAGATAPSGTAAATPPAPSSAPQDSAVSTSSAIEPTRTAVAPQGAHTPRVEAMPRPAPAGAFDVEPGDRDYVVPFTNIRRRTAEHMVRSKATSAHTLMSIEVDFEAVERVRRRVREAFKAEEGFSLTYLPFVVRAAVEAIRAYPNINASVVGDALVVHRDINIAIAVDLNLEGLIAPVIHHADAIRLRGIARAIHDLATRARSRKLNADDIAGGTFTITNPGPFGTFMTGAIINQPQVAILATDGITRRPVVVTDELGGESIAIHSVGLLTVNFDHRAIDGAYAAAFLAKAKQVIEQTSWEQEL